MILKKSLGQHFLKDEHVLQKIVTALQQHSFTKLLEVGAGGGALTKHLLAIPDIDFKTVELDDEKVMLLQKQYPPLKDKIIHKDFLQIDLPFDGSFILIGNFPYNISTEILFKALEWKEQVDTIIGMFQKEVAQRVVAASGNKMYGVISVLIQAFYDAEYLFDVSPESFTPPPKVMSGVIRLTKKMNPISMKSDKSFKLLVKSAFNQRRKMLRNAVRGLFDEAILQEDIFNKRAEQLAIADFAALTFRMKNT